jgi:hypothetical protein
VVTVVMLSASLDRNQSLMMIEILSLMIEVDVVSEISELYSVPFA